MKTQFVAVLLSIALAGCVSPVDEPVDTGSAVEIVEGDPEGQEILREAEESGCALEWSDSQVEDSGDTAVTGIGQCGSAEEPMETRTGFTVDPETGMTSGLGFSVVFDPTQAPNEKNVSIEGRVIVRFKGFVHQHGVTRWTEDIGEFVIMSNEFVAASESVARLAPSPEEDKANAPALPGHDSDWERGGDDIDAYGSLQACKECMSKGATHGSTNFNSLLRTCSRSQNVLVAAGTCALTFTEVFMSNRGRMMCVEQSSDCCISDVPWGHGTTKEFVGIFPGQSFQLAVSPNLSVSGVSAFYEGERATVDKVCGGMVFGTAPEVEADGLIGSGTLELVYSPF